MGILYILNFDLNKLNYFFNLKHVCLFTSSSYFDQIRQINIVCLFTFLRTERSERVEWKWKLVRTQRQCFKLATRRTISAGNNSKLSVSLSVCQCDACRGALMNWGGGSVELFVSPHWKARLTAEKKQLMLIDFSETFQKRKRRRVFLAKYREKNPWKLQKLSRDYPGSKWYNSINYARITEGSYLSLGYTCFCKHFLLFTSGTKTCILYIQTRTWCTWIKSKIH